MLEAGVSGAITGLTDPVMGAHDVRSRFSLGVVSASPTKTSEVRGRYEARGRFGDGGSRVL